MDASTLLDATVKTFIGAAAAAVVAVVPYASLTFRLRRQLDRETAILGRLRPGRARRELDEQVQRRSLLLASALKYPAVALWDVVSIIGFVAMLVFGGVWLRTAITDEAASEQEMIEGAWSAAGVVWLTIVFALIVASVGHDRWQKRALDRVDYVEDKVDAVMALDLGRRFALVQRIAWPAVLLTLFFAGGVPLAFLVDRKAITLTAMAVTVLIGILAVVVASLLICCKTKLARRIKPLDTQADLLALAPATTAR